MRTFLILNSFNSLKKYIFNFVAFVGAGGEWSPGGGVAGPTETGEGCAWGGGVPAAD